MPKKFGFRGVRVVSLLREVRLHLSIAFESQLSLLCIRLALTLLSRSQAAPQHSFWEPALIALHSVGTDIASRSQAAPQHSFLEPALIALHSVGTDIASRSLAAPQHSFWEPALIALHSVGTDIASRSQAAPQFDGWKNNIPYLFSVLWHFATTESRAGRPVWNTCIWCFH